MLFIVITVVSMDMMHNMSQMLEIQESPSFLSLRPSEFLTAWLMAIFLFCLKYCCVPVVNIVSGGLRQP